MTGSGIVVGRNGTTTFDTGQVKRYTTPCGCRSGSWENRAWDLPQAGHGMSGYRAGIGARPSQRGPLLRQPFGLDLGDEFPADPERVGHPLPGRGDGDAAVL